MGASSRLVNVGNYGMRRRFSKHQRLLEHALMLSRGAQPESKNIRRPYSQDYSDSKTSHTLSVRPEL